MCIIINHFNIHRYAFTPLMDDSDDEEIEEFVASTNIGTVTSWEPYPEHLKHLQGPILLWCTYI